MNSIKIYRYNPYFILPMTLFGLLLGKPAYVFFYKLLVYNDYTGAIVLILAIDYFLVFFVKYTWCIVKKVPVIVITPDFIFLRRKGYAIAWHDIESVNKGRGLSMSLRKTWRNRANVKSPFLKIYYFILANTVLVPGALIAGDTEQMSITIRDYYFRYRYN